MSTALMTSPAHELQDLIFDDLRLRQQRIAEITEMIHVSFLLLFSWHQFVNAILFLIISLCFYDSFGRVDFVFSESKWVLSTSDFDRR